MEFPPLEVKKSLAGQAEDVTGLALHPREKWLFSSSFDRTVVQWNRETGEKLRTFGTPGSRQAGLLSLSLSPDGSLFATTSMDNSAKIWELNPVKATRSEQTAIKSFGHPNTVFASNWHPEGKQLATCCHDGLLRIWNVEKGQTLRTINAHNQPKPSPIYSIRWTSDGRQLLSSSLDKSLKLFDAGDGKLIREFRPFDEKNNPLGHWDQVLCSELSADGKWLLSGSADRSINIWNFAEAKVAHRLAHPEFKNQSHPNAIYALKLTPDNKYLVAVGPGKKSHGYLSIWELASAKFLYGSELPQGNANTVAEEPQNKSLWVGFASMDAKIPHGELVRFAWPLK
ncbi:WD40 repeat domain-containing protein [Telmatocola sphagniphila]|uniref:WD40 repeat domain-containing protein n=1 Tax=Telmatocola sphagniphila TaxID=1123043 RepID=A0A8E6EYW5_9BACT|nr:WD40 repeat domain-containing protein [Telmatocola sphagniphila]QVL33113.1 WD40 repeat domain-containing protein [Telmatocola sphagniphila]